MLVSEVEINTRLVLHGHERVRIGPRWAQTGLRSPFWRLYIHDRDGAEVCVGSQVYPLEPGRVHLIPAWLRLSHRTPHALQHFYVHFSMVRWTGRVTRRLAPAPVSLPLTRVLAATWRAVQDRYDADPAPSPVTSMQVTALVQSALAQWLGGLDAAEVQRVLHPAGGRPDVEPALTYIETHLGNRIDNPALAELCHLSVDHFVRVFRRAVGQTPGRYVSECRIAAAAQALAFTSRTIDDISQSLGYPNRFYFTRVFTRHIGAPPAAYRANQGIG